MRVSEVLSLKPADIDDQELLLYDPKSERELEVGYGHKLQITLKQDKNCDHTIYRLTEFN